MVYSHEICATDECPLDLKLHESADYGWKYMSPTKEGLAKGHEVSDCVVAIPDKLWVVNWGLMIAVSEQYLVQHACD